MKKQLFVLAAATAVAVSLAPSAPEATQIDANHDVMVNILGGSLDLTTADPHPFGKHKLSSTTGIITSTFKAPIIVEDATGLQAGWRLSAKAVDFVGYNDQNVVVPGASIPAYNVSLIKPVVKDMTSGNAAITDNTRIELGADFGAEGSRVSLGKKLADGTSQPVTVHIATGKVGASGGKFAFEFGDVIPTATAPDGSVGNPLGDVHAPNHALELTVDPSVVKLNDTVKMYKSVLTWELVAGPN